MNSDLKLDWCSHEAAKFACEHWHYSRTMPAGKAVMIGIMECGVFIGSIIFSRGSNKAIGMPYQLDQTQVCELTRVALKKHHNAVSRMVAISIRMLHKQSVGLRLIVSYADPREGHIGGIYQAGNWIYVGTSTGNDRRNHPYQSRNGKIIHWRTMSGICGRYGKPHTEKTAVELGYKPLQFMAKHKYLMPLDEEMRQRIEPLRRPYPKRAGSETVTRPELNHPAEGGSIPTPALTGA